MGLTQDFGGLIEPDDPAWLRADSASKRRYYDAAGMIVLDELAKQLGKGVGRNGRAMKVRIQPVLADGADGPVMEPHYLGSRVITLADYAATDHGLKLFWHAGTGHRTHRKARSKGQKATPFGEILGYHADGLVPHAPVRDVRLCPQRIQNVRNKLKTVWQGLLKTGRFAPAPKPEKRPGPRLPTAPTLPTLPTAPSGPKRLDQGHEVPPPPHPTPAPKAPEAPKAPVFKPGYLNPPPTLYTGKHPTPTHPIPVYTSTPKRQPKGPYFVVPGSGGKAKPKGKVLKPAPKPPPLPPRQAPPPKPVPKPAPVPMPVVAQPLPKPFYPPPPPPPTPKPTPRPRTAETVPYGSGKAAWISKAIQYAESKGIPTRVGKASDFAGFGANANRVFAYYAVEKDEIVINAEQRAWQAPDSFMMADPSKPRQYFSSTHPQHIIHHEVGHALHARGLGLEEYYTIRDNFTRPEDVATALRVSTGAAINTSEFVAETFAGMLAGKDYDPGVKALYQKLGGPPVR